MPVGSRPTFESSPGLGRRPTPLLRLRPKDPATRSQGASDLTRRQRALLRYGCKKGDHDRTMTAILTQKLDPHDE
jgi:hypothetical protein